MASQASTIVVSKMMIINSAVITLSIESGRANFMQCGPASWLRRLNSSLAVFRRDKAACWSRNTSQPGITAARSHDRHELAVVGRRIDGLAVA